MSFIVEGMLSMEEENHGTMSMTKGVLSVIMSCYIFKSGENVMSFRLSTTSLTGLGTVIDKTQNNVFDKTRDNIDKTRDNIIGNSVQCHCPN